MANDIMTQQFFFFFFCFVLIASQNSFHRWMKQKENEIAFAVHMLLYASASAHAKEDNDNHVFHFSVLLMRSKPHSVSDTKTKTAIQAFGLSFIIIWMLLLFESYSPFAFFLISFSSATHCFYLRYESEWNGNRLDCVTNTTQCRFIATILPLWCQLIQSLYNAIILLWNFLYSCKDKRQILYEKCKQIISSHRIWNFYNKWWQQFFV